MSVQGCLLVAVLLLAGIVPVAEAAIISSSQLQFCTNDGSETVPCERKFVVALSIDGDQADTETVSYWRSSASPEGNAINLQKPVTIRVRKSRPMIRYPLIYAQNFNAQPYERTVFTGALKCHASTTDADPTCGRQFRDDSTPIPYSEGYCCSCSFCELFGVCKSDSRANTNCALFGDGAAASCLSFAELWYSGYRIGAAETWYTITVTISDGARTSVLLVGPDQLGAVDRVFGVSVRLVGDFAKFKEALSFSSKLLLVPAAPTSHARVLAAPPTEWLMLESSLVTLDGSECNKVGVAHSGFAAQGNRCVLKSGSCTTGQIEELRASDLQRKQQGLAQQYMVAAFGTFVYIPPSSSQRSFAVADSDDDKRDLPEDDDPSTVNALAMRDVTRMVAGETRASVRGFMPEDATKPYLAYEQTGVQASLLTFTFVADNMSFTVNVAAGRILSWNISSFSAGSANGNLRLVVANTGNVTADFHVSVKGCSPDTFPISAQVRSVSPLSVTTLTFNVYSSDTAGGSSACNVTLFNALFEPIHEVVVRWTTTQIQTNSPQTGGGGNTGNTGGTPSSSASGGEDCTDCPFYNPLCFLLRRCFWQIIVQVLLVVGIAVGILLVIRHRKALIGILHALFGKDKQEHTPPRKESPPTRTPRKQPPSDDSEEDRRDNDRRRRRARRRRRQRLETWGECAATAAPCNDDASSGSEMNPIEVSYRTRPAQDPHFFGYLEHFRAPWEYDDQQLVPYDTNRSVAAFEAYPYPLYASAGNGPCGGYDDGYGGDPYEDGPPHVYPPGPYPYPYPYPYSHPSDPHAHADPSQYHHHEPYGHGPPHAAPLPIAWREGPPPPQSYRQERRCGIRPESPSTALSMARAVAWHEGSGSESEGSMPPFQYSRSPSIVRGPSPALSPKGDVRDVVDSPPRMPSPHASPRRGPPPSAARIAEAPRGLDREFTEEARRPVFQPPRTPPSPTPLASGTRGRLPVSVPPSAAPPPWDSGISHGPAETNEPTAVFFDAPRPLEPDSGRFPRSPAGGGSIPIGGNGPSGSMFCGSPKPQPRNALPLSLQGSRRSSSTTGLG